MKFSQTLKMKEQKRSLVKFYSFYVDALDCKCRGLF